MSFRRSRPGSSSYCTYRQIPPATGNYPTIVIDDQECLAGYDEEKIQVRLG
jgi:hypothetical protein